MPGCNNKYGKLTLSYQLHRILIEIVIYICHLRSTETLNKKTSMSSSITVNLKHRLENIKVLIDVGLHKCWHLTKWHQTLQYSLIIIECVVHHKLKERAVEVFLTTLSKKCPLFLNEILQRTYFILREEFLSFSIARSHDTEVRASSAVLLDVVTAEEKSWGPIFTLKSYFTMHRGKL